MFSTVSQNSCLKNSGGEKEKKNQEEFGKRSKTYTVNYFIIWHYNTFGKSVS